MLYIWCNKNSSIQAFLAEAHLILVIELSLCCKTLTCRLTEYTVDVRKKEVTIKGDFIANCNFQNETISSNTLQSANDPPKSLSTFLTHSDQH